MMKSEVQNDSSISNKDWLEIAWKNFQQHAQQRIAYFNYFIIFSTILTTGLLTTFTNQFIAPRIGIALGLLQALLSYAFAKIDYRNKRITKLCEQTLRRIENRYAPPGLNLFQLENKRTRILARREKKKNFLFREFTHGQIYIFLYKTFFILGILGAMYSYIHNSNKP